MKHIAEKMNQLGSQRIPFIFIIGFDNGKYYIQRLDKTDNAKLLYKIGRYSNAVNLTAKNSARTIVFNSYPVDYKTYLKAYNQIYSQIMYGNSYLTNLTFATPVECNISLKEIFIRSESLYRIWLNNEFACFSPECFVRIENGVIYSYPMKGTIPANIEGAKQKLLDDEKENAEHTTIVDLIRNDLAMVAENIRVKRFKYIDLVKTSKTHLFQMSSEICGDVPTDYHQNIGDIITRLLPAGSVTGAPKKKTVEIIQQTETSSRSWYTGIAGIFDGYSLDSCVLIRLIEQTNNGLLFHSGGGITFMSQPENEYHEMIEKIYLPFAL